nr:MAG TPA: Insulin Chain A, Insulin Chain, HORMONE.18A [Caudoviricetes sp.]
MTLISNTHFCASLLNDLLTFLCVNTARYFRAIQRFFSSERLLRRR